MHVAQRTNTFDGCDLSVVWQTGQLGNAGARHLAINDDVTSTAMALAATNLTTC